MSKITLYRIEDKDGVGPQFNHGQHELYVINPRYMDNVILWQRGDDPFKFKYACTSLQNLKNYFYKAHLEYLLSNGYSIVTKVVPESTVRLARTSKVAAFKFTNEEAFPNNSIVAVGTLSEAAMSSMQAIKNAALEAYYSGNYHLDSKWSGQWGFLEFIKTYVESPELVRSNSGS